MYKCFEVMGNKCESDIHGGRKNHSLLKNVPTRSQLLQLFEDKCELSETEKLWHQATQLFDFEYAGVQFYDGGWVPLHTCDINISKLSIDIF